MAFTPFSNGQYNVTPPVLTNGQVAPLQLDVNGNLKTGSVAAGIPGNAVPAQAILLGASDGTDLQSLLVESSTYHNLRVSVFNGANEQPSGDVPARAIVTELTDGTNILGTTAHPVNTQDAATGATNATAPVDAIEIGIVDNTGKLQAASATNPVPVTGSVTATNPSVGATGAAVPTDATFIGASDGTDLQGLLVESTANKNLRVSVFNGANEQPSGDTPARAIVVEITDGTNILGTTSHPVNTLEPSTGVTGVAAPADATEMGIVDSTGKLQAVSATNPVPVTGSITATNPSVGVIGSATPADATLMGATDGTDLRALNVDGSGYLKVNVSAGSAGNSAASATGSAVPADADYLGFNSGGNLVGVSSSNPLPAKDAADGTPGSAVPAVAILVGGTDGTDLRALLTDTGGQLKVLVENSPSVTVSGTVTAEIEGHSGASLDAAPGSALPTNAILVGGSDGTDLRALATDTSGREIVVGAAATGAAVAGNPVLVAGSDGTDARTIATDTGGQVKVLVENSPTVTAEIEGHAGAVLDAVVGAAVPTSAILVGGSDGTDLRAIATDSGGQVKVLVENSPAVTISGSVSVTQGTTPWVTEDKSDAAITSGVGTNSGFATQTAGQYNTSQVAPTNGQQVAAQVDQAGNALEFPGVQTLTGAVWGTGTSQNTLQYPTGTATEGQPLGGPAVLCQLDMSSGTFSAGAVTFQGTYDNVNWVTIPVAQILNPQTLAQLANPYTFVTNVQVPFLILLQGFQQIRIKLTTAITGSSTPTVTPYWTVLSKIPVLVSPANGPVTAGTAAPQSMLIGGVAATTAPAPTAGQQIALQLDSNGSLRTTPYGATGSFQSSNSGTKTGNTGIVVVTFTVPAATKWVLNTIVVSWPTLSNSGSARIITMGVFDASGNSIGSGAMPSIPITTGAFTAVFGPGLPAQTSVANGNTSYPMPVTYLGPSFTVSVFFQNVVSADSFSVNLGLIAYPN